MNAISARALNPVEWQRLRDLRLQALQSAPGVYALSYEECASWTDARWQSGISGAGHQIFGLFDGERLIGITGVFTWDGDPSGQTALLVMSYIEPEYRGRGLSRQLYEVRLHWIRQSGRFQTVHVSHRASNEASRRANQHHGFVKTGAEPFEWPDGAIEDEIHYELKL